MCDLKEGLVHRGTSVRDGTTTLEKGEARLWDKFKDDPHPDVFSHLELAEDGGFSEVKDLYSHSRWTMSSVLVLFVVYNCTSVLKLDLAFIADPPAAVNALAPGMSNTIQVHMQDTVLNSFYFSRSISDGIVQGISGETTATVSPVKIIGAMELMWLSYYVLTVIICAFRAKFGDGFAKWSSIQFVFWDTLPALSSYSAMKLLNAIVPAVFLTVVFGFISKIQEAKADKRTSLLLRAYIGMVGWLVFTFFSFIVGFDTFLMKLRIVSIVANQPTLSASVVIPCVQFLVQVVGVVQLGPFVRNRLFVFIFGGEDGVMQEEETQLMQCWLALLARKIYTDLPFVHFIGVMLSFSDEDFQSLVLNEDARVKEKQLRS
mmetsp:Transcript_88416/g.250603  ORF Transcript_88416/g.250603 Transcript_88416/m.250603 type:complete len:374 (-) Transcript_88416:195-1316(-)|eukprot:CAMPEP_0168388004 /NCGR_PEP_ID=MMETSP0228-20121227/16232_1 /TAXON_ID=133427 /ORGANISM="Protoceratium reticulatum, Strain CCCM 535 (=CCMP 1889)" /LENGTH=373 /DNA_ID=CAMNT_0008401247 /DNA_START=117 /DNA_END=1238 /DNA_ORIENTATION=-